ncbi:MAG: ABC transporter ATP-binding protein [Deltaproteobacteria bacterium]|nr:ABC transporter ATP-binding protein [Deltaproteobacteria bacterium]
MTDDSTIIDVQGLVKRFGHKTVVNGVSLKVKRGEIYGFLGPNGSGKTTTIRMLCGLLRPDGGSGECLGWDIISESTQIKFQVGYMAQRFSLYEDLTVKENLDFIATLYGIRSRREAVARAIERIRLERFANQLAGTLSGGWKQRLALACCMIHQPKLLLLDEPTAGVDPKARREFWEEVHKLAGEGITSMISTHYMDEAERCHRLAYIAYGNLLTAGTVEQVVAGENLTTWLADGGNIHALQERLQGLAGVDQIVPFGNTLHVSGKDADTLEKSITPFMDAGYRWTRTTTSLEEVFISLMGRAGGD